MKQTNEDLRMSPKLKRVLTEAYGLQYVGGNAVCAEYNGLLRISRQRHGNDNENIFTLVWNCLTALRESDYTEETLHLLTLHGFAPFLFRFTVHNDAKYDIIKLDAFIVEMREMCKAGKFGAAMLNDFTDAARILRVYHDDGRVPKFEQIPRGKRTVCEQLEALVELYKNKIGEYRSVTPNAVPNRLYSVRGFLSYMERVGVKTAGEFTHKTVSAAITAYSQNHSGGIGSVLFVIRSFLTFLFEAGVTPIDYSVAMPQRIPKRRKMRFGFTPEEIVSVLGSVNRNSRIGKRDYAIMLTAARAGLRACDVAALKRKDIDWHNKEIRIVQQKTGVPLSIPLTPEVGNAIVDYFYNARRKNDSPYMFPLKDGASEHIKAPTISALTTKYMNISGIDDSLPYRGVHSFRRSFGKRLLDASLTPDMLMEMLGQVDVNSITPYTAIYEDGLKRCALPLSSVHAGAL